MNMCFLLTDRKLLKLAKANTKKTNNKKTKQTNIVCDRQILRNLFWHHGFK